MYLGVNLDFLVQRGPDPHTDSFDRLTTRDALPASCVCMIANIVRMDTILSC